MATHSRVLAGAGDPGADIEDTLVSAARAGMENGNLRFLSILVTWWGVHHARVNADRLFRTVSGAAGARERALWAALARWSRDPRFARLGRLHRGPRIDLVPTGSDFLIRRRGEDPRFVASPLRVPAGTLRDDRPTWPLRRSSRGTTPGTAFGCSWVRRTERTCGPCSSASRR